MITLVQEAIVYAKWVLGKPVEVTIGGRTWLILPSVEVQERGGKL